MFPGTCHSLLWTCFIAVTCAQLSTPVEQKVITAESGQSVTLPCHAPSNKILLLEWTRPDLAKEEYVFLFRDQQFNPANQHPSFKNRVDLQDKEMKDGNVSVILKNVTINDTGTYECRVLQRETNRRKRANLDTDPISIIDLSVVPPGQTHTEDGGEKSGSVGLIAGVLVAAVLLVAAVSGYLIYRKHKKQNQDSYQPPVEMHHV